MKFFILAALLAVVSAGYRHHQAPGPTEADQAPGPSPADQPGQPIGQAPGPSESATNYANARRQHQVNVEAVHYGAGVGTAPYYGVPGTGFHNNGRYHGHGYGHNGAYNGGNGYGGYGHNANHGYNNGQRGGYYKH